VTQRWCGIRVLRRGGATDYRLLVALIALLAGCRDVPAFDPLPGGVDRAVVLRRGDSIGTISDSVRLRELRAFIDARRSGWKEPAMEPPFDTIRVDLFAGRRFMGSFGVAKRSFLLQRHGIWVVRKASDAEIDSFRLLLSEQ
jgi:hypothetical protein